VSVAGFFHAGITVRDLDEALRFYRDGLGLEVLERRRTADSSWATWNLHGDHVELVFLQIPGTDTVLELYEFNGIERHDASSRPCDYGAGHICLYVHELPALHARLTGMGYASRSPVQRITNGPLTGKHVVYMLDPDGYNIELLER
jgi:catechol 2,3-dioxygenase-like lactoylglutathione lyase family enzyme